MIVIVTGTGTDIGKTVTTAALAICCEAVGVEALPLKPVQTGEGDGRGDIASITRLTGIEGHEMVRFPDPLSPDLAARSSGKPAAQLEEVAAWVRRFDQPRRLVLVEGAGGVLVRMGEGWDITDLARALHAPAVVVTTMGLGSLNATALTCEALASRGIEIAGLIGSGLPRNPDLATRLNLQALPAQVGIPLIGVLPSGLGAVDRETFVRIAREALADAARHLTTMR